MAISATTAEDTWFNGPKTRLGGFGGGICSVGTNPNNNNNNNLDSGRLIDADVVVSSGCANNRVINSSSAPTTTTKLVRQTRSVQFRDASDVADDDDDDQPEEEDDDVQHCGGRGGGGSHVEDEYYGPRRLLLSALSAATVVPARHRVVEFPFRRKKSYLFKRKRRPSLSNVVEIYEHSPAASGGGGSDGCEKSVALSACGGGDGDDVVVQKANTNSVVCGGESGALGVANAARPTTRMPDEAPLDGSGGEFDSAAGGPTNLISFSCSVSGDVNSRSQTSNSSSSSSRAVRRTSETQRLLSSACDLRDHKCGTSVRRDVDFDHHHRFTSIKCRNASLSKSWYGGEAFAVQPDIHDGRCTFSNGRKDDEDIDAGRRAVAGRGGIDDDDDDDDDDHHHHRKSRVNYAQHRKSTCTCLAEYEDSDDVVGEIGVNSEERVVLLQRSASVPDDGNDNDDDDDDGDDALSRPPAKKFTTKATSTTRLDRDADDELHAATVPLVPSSLPSVDRPSSITRCSRTSSTTTTTLMTSSTSRLGKWSKSKIDLKVPSLKSLVTMATNKLSASRPANLNYWRNGGGGGAGGNNCSSSSRTFNPTAATTLRRNISLNNVAHRHHSLQNAISSDDVYLLNPKLRKCKTMLTLSGCVGRNCSSSGGGGGGGVDNVGHAEPLRMVNRLRVCSNVQEPHLPLSRIYSRCSSILSMASSSRYSLNSSCGFVPVSAPTVLCKVCLNEVPIKDSWTLQHCECSYCVDCVRSYVEFEINQGAYSISCPDAQCEKQGIILLEEIESLVSLEYIEKHKRYRLNREVEMDKSRTWCPRAGCETVCTLCSTDRCTPQSVHCPTCNMDFCSNCRVSWHGDSPCKSEEVVPGVTFDSELIKCCPMCSVPIEKDEGCAQMLCKRCKHVFCWYCLASLDDDFLLRHYDKGPCKNKLGHSRASVIWHRTQVISIFAGFGILLLIASPLLLLAAPCIVCCKCRVCTSDSKLDADDDLPEAVELQPNLDVVSASSEKDIVVAAADSANEVQS